MLGMTFYVFLHNLKPLIEYHFKYMQFESMNSWKTSGGKIKGEECTNPYTCKLKIRNIGGN